MVFIYMSAAVLAAVGSLRSGAGEPRAAKICCVGLVLLALGGAAVQSLYPQLPTLAALVAKWG